ncbi:hypothetical protein ABNM12_12795 [Pseudomonas syringae]|uniref:hypothetical protein n=1 Tax=Pseudomonas TaxID=286 RepID=UPI0004103BFC|nr:hypothetical protein [Pseudomonas syringae]MCH5554948.1 hypothetical protein [Pseudomonas syringae pv. syringae]MCH5574508.1 hypothetical protein [Pseudomonas syringae pv. syringae]MCH5666605.1 hypothetical protein [Pseudomonas syringae pv. syringae]PBP50884.1 hypothetical protein CCL11_03500 [Pseudomonas syringae]PPS47905.1 hypothetical protein B0F86_02135 [Pseudomonas syringae]
MYKALATISFLTILSATISGCDKKPDNLSSAANTKVTHYSFDKCNIDSIAGKTGASIYVNREVVEFNGWAFDPIKQEAPKEIRLRLTGYKGAPDTFKDPAIIDRPDLVKAFKNEKLLKSGFSFKADLSSFESGGYSVVIEIPGENSSSLCQSKVLLVIK